jgi:PTS system glucose-specific IIA component
MPMPLTILAPVAGTVMAMSEIPDLVLAGEIVGPGLAIDPSRYGMVTAIAPVAGKIVKLHAHSYVIVAEGTRGALVHLGLDTVQLGGTGFTLHVAEGDSVAAGEVVVSWNPSEIEAGGRSPICPVIAPEGVPGAVTALVAPGGLVCAGDPLFECA